MSRKIEDLVPWFQPKVIEFKKHCERIKLPILITRTLTDDFTQEAIWTVGRGVLSTEQTRRLKEEGLYPQDTSKVKTKARYARETPHGCGLAFDGIVLLDGKPWWSVPDHVWKAVYNVAERCGLDAMGDKWGEFLSWDPGHFSEPGWWIYRPAG
jgi:hypothetical protein